MATTGVKLSFGGRKYDNKRKSGTKKRLRCLAAVSGAAVCLAGYLVNMTAISDNAKQIAALRKQLGDQTKLCEYLEMVSQSGLVPENLESEAFERLGLQRASDDRIRTVILPAQDGLAEK